MAQIPSIINMDIDNDIVKERSTFSSRNRSKKSFILLKVSFVVYHEQMDIINNLLLDEA